MLKAWRRAAIAALAGGAAIAAQLTVIAPAQAAGPTISIFANAKLKPVSGYVMVVYLAGNGYRSASIHGKISNAAAGDVATLYAQQFPYKTKPAPIASKTLTAGTQVYGFTVTPSLATHYDIRLFASKTAKTPITTSAVQNVYVEPGGKTTGGATCGRPVCHETFHLWWIVPSSVLGPAMKDPVYAYLGLNLGTGVNPPPPPNWLYKNGGNAKISGPFKVNAGEYETTIRYSFTIGNDAYYWLWTACGRDQVTKDGLGIPGYHSCGASRIPRTITYLG
jgi:hypothetical protein